MFRLCSTHAARLAVSVTVLSVGLHLGGAPVTGSLAAGTKPGASPKAPTATQPVTGKIQSATKTAITLSRAGTKKVTHIQLNAGTQYIVKGKRVAKLPAFTRGLLISVVTTQSKGSYTAQIVIVGSTPPVSSSAVPAPPPSASSATPSGAMTVSGVVTLASAASVTLKTSSGTQTIKLTTSTHYLINGKQSTSRPTLHAGEKVKIVAAQFNGMLVGQLFTVL